MRRPDEAHAYEVLAWHLAEQRKPDSDTTVICWMEDGEWFSGWWDADRQRWMDVATGGTLDGVKYWAAPEGPEC